MATPSVGVRRGVIIAALSIAALGGIYVAMRSVPHRVDIDASTTAATDLAPEAAPSAGVDQVRLAAAQEAARLGAAPPVRSSHLNDVAMDDPAEFQSRLPVTTLFVPSEEARRYFDGKLKHAPDIGDFIEFNRAALIRLKPNSVIGLQMPDTGRKVDVVIKQVQVHANGDRSWIGEVRNPRGQPLPAVFTQGRFATMGEITTPDRSYNLEARGRHAWIASVDEIRRRLPPMSEDGVVPPPNELPPPPPRS